MLIEGEPGSLRVSAGASHERAGGADQFRWHASAVFLRRSDGEGELSDADASSRFGSV